MLGSVHRNQDRPAFVAHELQVHVGRQVLFQFLRRLLEAGDHFQRVGALHLDELDGQQLLAIIERSEEHTSELQSLMRISYAVFCLKKKINNSTKYTTNMLRKQSSIYVIQARLYRNSIDTKHNIATTIA